MNYEIELINVGREDKCEKIIIENVSYSKILDEALRIVSQYLMSSVVELIEEENNLFIVQVGGWRPVGKVKITKLK